MDEPLPTLPDPPRERLIRFITDRGLSQAEAGELLGCSQGLVSKILRGDRKPGLALAFKIERATEGWSEGPIRAQDWTREEPADAPLEATGS